MTPRTDKLEYSASDLAELSALADGTLEPSRRAEVEAQIAGSPELSELYARERKAVELLHEARAVDRAPARLRTRIEASRPSARVAARRRAGYAGALASALAAVIVALVLVLPGGAPGAPSVSQAAALATRGPSSPAPAPDPSHPTVNLGRNIEDVYFPNWSTKLGWRATGQRADRINGRLALTVYYGWRGRTVAYTIVGAPPLSQPAAHLTNLNGTELRTLSLDGRLVVTWRRGAHTCVLSGVGVPASVLQQLAAWKVPAVSS